MYGRSAIADNFFNCSVEYFKPNPNRILFNLVFKVSEPNKVTGRDVVSTFMQVAPTVQDQGYNYFHIGGLFLRRPDAAKRTTLAPPVSVPHTVTVTPPKQQTINVIYNGTQVKLNYRLFERSYDERLLQNTSSSLRDSRLVSVKQSGNTVMISSAFLKSRFSQRFYNCHVLFVQPFPPRVQFYVYLSTPLSDYLIANVTEVIDNYLPAVYIQQERYLNATGYYLYPGAFNHTQIPVNITEQLYRERQRSSNPVQPSSSTAEEDSNVDINRRVVYHDATMASYEFGLKDFVITKDLLNMTSPSFIKISGEFCSEVRKLMNSSKLNSEYWLCQIESFNVSSQSVKFYLIFVSPMVDSLKNETLNVLSPNFSSTSNIASLNLSGENKMVDLKPVNISDFLPENENTPMHSGLRPVPKPQYPGMMNQTLALNHSGASTDAVLLPLKFKLHNFTYAQDLIDPTSEHFKSYSTPLCKSIGKYFAHTHLTPIFKGCQVDSFSEIPASVSFHLIFSTDSTSKLKESVLEIISMSARHRKVNGEELIRVGNLYLVWKESSIQQQQQQQQGSWATQSAQQSQRMSSNLQQGIQSPNYRPVTPPNTVTRSGSRRSTFARAINTHPRLDIRRTTMSRSVNNEDGDNVVNAKADLTADISYELHNLVYTYDMANETSVTFQNKESDFCKDIDNFYQNSNISNSYRKCSILSIKSEPPSVTFRLVFTRSDSEVHSDIIRVLEHRAPRLNKSGKEVLKIGDMFLVWRNYSVVLSTAREGQTGASMWAAGDNPKSVKDAIEITSTVKLYNFSYDPLLADSTSKIFSKFQKNFCENIKTFYNNISLVLLGCNILMFRREPPFVSYRLVFALNNTSLPQLMDKIVNRIPKDNEDSGKLIPIGGLFLIWYNRTDKMRKIAWNKKATFWNNDHASLPWTCTSNPCGSSLWMDIRLFNFTLTPELQHRQSERFQKIMNTFCADIRRIIDKSSLLHPLGYCSINKFGHNPPHIRFQLILDELPSKNLTEKIEKVFELSGHWKINGQKQKLLHLGDLWLQWTKRTIRLEPFFMWQDSDKTASSYSSGPFGEVTVNVEVPIFNLSFSSNLYDIKSDLFKSSAQEICKEVSKWIQNSSISQEFYACKVLGFSPNPNMVSFQLSFRGQHLDASAKKELEKFFQFSPKMVKHNGQLVLPTGNYYLSWPQRRVKMYFVRHTVVNVTPADVDHSMNSFINTGSGNQRNVTQNHLNTITSLELKTYNMSENPDLHNRSSEKFQELEHKFCAQMSSIYSRSHLYEIYKGCQLSGVGSDFKSIKFHLMFTAQPTGKLQTDILEVLQNQSPKIFTEGTTLLHIGGLFFKWDENYIHMFSTNNSVIMKMQREPTSIYTTADSNNRTHFVSEICKMSFRFHLYNFTYNSEISDVNSELFQDYSRRLCSDIFAVYKNSSLNGRLLNCTLVTFGHQPNTVEFSLFFNKSSVSNLQGSARDVLEDKAPHLTLDHLDILFLGGLHMIWKGYTIHTQVYNITFTRSPLTIVILYEAILANLTIGVFNLTHTSELGDNKSETFIKYESSVCGGFNDIFKKSDPVWPLRTCNMKSVQLEPPSLNVHLVFVKPLADEQSLLTHLNNSAPHIRINGIDLIRLGDVIVNLQQAELSLKPVNLSTPTTWNSNIPPDALVTQYTPSDPDGDTSKRRYVVLVHDATLTILNVQVLNMSFIPEFDNTSSPAFLDFNNKLCSNITSIFKSTLLASYYYMCNVRKFSSSPLTVTIDLVFVAPYQESLIKNVTHVLKETAAHKRFQGRDALWIDNILLDWGTYNISMEAVNLTNILRNRSAWNNPQPFLDLNATKDITVIKYEATLLNLTYSLSGFRYTNDLANSASKQFRKYAMEFCNEVDRLMVSSILAVMYHGCRLRKFSTGPNTAMFQLAIRLPESSTLIQNITTILKKNAKHQPSQQTWLLQLGGLSLNLNTARVSSSVFNITGSEWPIKSVSADGWLVRLGLRPYNTTDQDDLRNSSSPVFKEYSHTLCNAIDRMYAKSNLSQRYVSCKIEARDNPLKIIFGLIFRKREEILPNEIITVLQRFRDPHTNVASIANIYFWMDNITLSYESHQVPELNVLDITFDVINPPYNKTMEDSTSKDFQALAKPYCNYLDNLYKEEGRFLAFKSCKVIAFNRNPNTINFHLLFSGEIDSRLHENIISMLNEKAPRQVVRGQTAFKIGGLLILKKSVTTDLRRRSENNLNRNSETRVQGSGRERQSVYAYAVASAWHEIEPENSSIRNGKPADPCAPDKNGDYFPHPTSCKMFIQCSFGRSHTIPCKPGLVYDPAIKSCVAESAHVDCTNERR